MKISLFSRSSMKLDIKRSNHPRHSLKMSNLQFIVPYQAVQIDYYWIAKKNVFFHLKSPSLSLKLVCSGEGSYLSSFKPRPIHFFTNKICLNQISLQSISSLISCPHRSSMHKFSLPPFLSSSMKLAPKGAIFLNHTESHCVNWSSLHCHPLGKRKHTSRDAMSVWTQIAHLRPCQTSLRPK